MNFQIHFDWSLPILKGQTIIIWYRQDISESLRGNGLFSQTNVASIVLSIFGLASSIRNLEGHCLLACTNLFWAIYHMIHNILVWLLTWWHQSLEYDSLCLSYVDTIILLQLIFSSKKLIVKDNKKNNIMLEYYAFLFFFKIILLMQTLHNFFKKLKNHDGTIYKI